MFPNQEEVHGLEDIFGDRIGFLFSVLYHLALSGQPCDVCTYSGQRYLDVKIGDDFVLAVMYGAGAQKLSQMLEKIKLKGKDTTEKVSIRDIWVVNPMPVGGFSPEELEQVDVTKGEEEIGPEGETLREMIRNTYHCKDEAEVDHFLRRFLAS